MLMVERALGEPEEPGRFGKLVQAIRLPVGEAIGYDGRQAYRKDWLIVDFRMSNEYLHISLL